MNAYYQKNSIVDSNNDIFEAYFLDGTARVGAWKKAADQVLSVLAAILTFLVSIPVRRALRVGGTAFSLVGMIGVIGAMESGALGLGAGLLIGLALISIEVLCLRNTKA